jgi:hypothetical protein
MGVEIFFSCLTPFWHSATLVPHSAPLVVIIAVQQYLPATGILKNTSRCKRPFDRDTSASARIADCVSRQVAAGFSLRKIGMQRVAGGFKPIYDKLFCAESRNSRATALWYKFRHSSMPE